MNPKEKAQELFEKHRESTNDIWNETSISFMKSEYKTSVKECVLNTIDEVETALTEYGAMSGELQNMDSEWRFWQSVRDELNSL